MTALFGDQPIIIAKTTGSGRRTIQFWGDQKVAGITGMICAASMDDQSVGTHQFAIHHGCPDEWLQLAWDTFMGMLAGTMPDATHTAEWSFGYGGTPTFTAATSSTGGTE